jgi:hypothetical protein
MFAETDSRRLSAQPEAGVVKALTGEREKGRGTNVTFRSLLDFSRSPVLL